VVGYGRNPYQAVQDFRSSLQRAISCVTPSVIAVRSATGYGVGSEHALTLGVPEAVKLPGAGISLSVRAYARVVERDDGAAPWRVDLASYFHTLRDAQGREVIAYHWHPEGRSPIDFPHLHLGAGSVVGREELQKAHIPTGRVELEDVLLMAIREFGIRPRRDDWQEILGTR
jgi:hypothetical protein